MAEIDRTQEDIDQDNLIAELARGVKDLKEQMRVVRDQQSAHDIAVRAQGMRLEVHQLRLDNLDPLSGIIEHIAAIKTFFDNWKRGFLK